MKLVFRLAFQSPDVAARPIVWLCSAPELEDRTGVYVHLRTLKECGDAARDPEAGARLWDAARVLVRRLREDVRAEAVADATNRGEA